MTAAILIIIDLIIRILENEQSDFLGNEWIAFRLQDQPVQNPYRCITRDGMKNRR
jgi:hypothetical protein